jgi:hypothetical protein
MPNGFYVSAADLGRAIRLLLKERTPEPPPTEQEFEGSGTTPVFLPDAFEASA